MTRPVSREELDNLLHEHAQWILGKRKKRPDGFVCTDLRGADMRYARLAGADLSGANMLGADLRGSDLSGAILRGANLKNTVLKDAAVGNAVFAYARNFVDAGIDPRGFRFIGVYHDEGWMVAAGCRWFTIQEAREHWGRVDSRGPYSRTHRSHAVNHDALARVELIARSKNID